MQELCSGCINYFPSEVLTEIQRHKFCDQCVMNRNISFFNCFLCMKNYLTGDNILEMVGTNSICNACNLEIRESIEIRRVAIPIDPLNITGLRIVPAFRMGLTRLTFGGDLLLDELLDRLNILPANIGLLINQTPPPPITGFMIEGGDLVVDELADIEIPNQLYEFDEEDETDKALRGVSIEKVKSLLVHTEKKRENANILIEEYYEKLKADTNDNHLFEETLDSLRKLNRERNIMKKIISRTTFKIEKYDNYKIIFLQTEVNENCFICTVDKILMILKCNHKLCIDCLCNIDNVCPFCRGEIIAINKDVSTLKE